MTLVKKTKMQLKIKIPVYYIFCAILYNMLHNTLQKEFVIRSIKVIDIAYITVFYFFTAYYLGYYLDIFFAYLYGTKYDTKTEFILTLEFLSQVIAIGILVYIVKNTVELIPFPLDGVGGFVHSRVKELSSGGFFTVFLVMFQYNLQNKLAVLKKKVEKRTITDKAL